MKAALVVVQGRSAGLEIPLKTPRFLIGRDPRCNLRPNSDLVSKLHCSFEVGDDGITLKDLGSTNGTVVNGQKLEGSRLLVNGDVVKVGPLVFALRVEAQQAAVAGPSGEEDAMEWLNAGTDGIPAEPSEGTTVLDVALAKLGANPDTDAELKQATAPPRIDPKPEPPKRDTREAASDILNRYFVRRRPG